MPRKNIHECEVRQWREDEITRERALCWVVISVEEAL
jgi:hypothetical protein